MRQRLCVFILLVLLCGLCIPSIRAQCNSEMTIYGFGPVPSGSSSFGQIVAAAGDVDNDGFPDILVAATQDYFSVDATVTVFSGQTGDSIRTYYRSSQSIYSAGGFGDFNGDNHADILANGIVFSGLTGDTLANYYPEARTGVGIGDADGDGVHDIVIPNPNWSGNVGRADLISGLTGDTLQSWTGNSSGGRFGNVAAAGDFNNDGYADVLIGEPLSDAGGADRGRIFVYSGFDGSELLDRVGFGNYHAYGTYISGAGDLDADGFDDILVAGQTSNSLTAPLRVWALSGQTGDTLFSVTEAGISYTDQYGTVLAGVGDITNDGHDDIAVGAHRWSSNRGNVYVYSGADGSFLYELYSRFLDARRIGSSVAGVGDTDGDGSDDFVMGAIWVDAPEDDQNDSYFRGAAYLYRCTYPDSACQIYDDFDGDVWSNVCDNCKWFVNFDQADADEDGIGDPCEADGYVVPGRFNYVDFYQMAWSGYDPQLTFDSISVGGAAHAQLTPAYFGDFRAVPFQGPMLYSFSTEAVFHGNITVKLPYLDTNLTTPEEDELQMFQKVDGYWRNITKGLRNNYGNFLTGVTSSLGDFAVGFCYATPDEDGDGVGDLCDNCPAAANPGQEDLDGNGIGDACETSQPVGTGDNVAADLNAADESIHLEFATVDQAGEVSVSVSPNGPASGANFTMVPADPPRYFDISTTALYTGSIIITMNYSDVDMTIEEEATLALWHYSDGNWINVTQELNTSANYVTGTVSSLSPFALGIDPVPTDIGDDTPDHLPQQYTLQPNYPNPFNPETVIEYRLPERTRVVIEVFNIAGQKVRTLVDAEKPAGSYRVTWHGDNAAGERVASGVYLYRFQAGDYSTSRKMLLLK